MLDWDLSELPNRMFDLTGKSALVVGGAGGLGRPTALSFADYGADVAVASRTLDDLETVAGEIEDLGQASLAVATDVTDEADVTAMTEAVTDEFGSLDVVVNYAGVNVPQPAEEYSLEDWNTVMGVKATGTFLVAREAGKVMIEQGGGNIINVSSVRGAFALPRNYLAYCASNGAINMITKQLACEWGRFNINVNAIAPTVIETEITEHLVADEDFAEQLRRGIPLGRWGQPEDLVGALIWLASDASEFITGQIVYIDGGTTTFDSID